MTLSLTESILQRIQKEIFEGETPEQSNVKSDIPQGTVMGPLLFLVYTNNLPDMVGSKGPIIRSLLP